MTAIETLSGTAILEIPDTDPERLFGREPAAIPALFNALVRRWHPDRNGGSKAAGEILAHVTMLRDAATARARAGTWRQPGVARFTDRITGRAFEIAYRKTRAFDLGEIYVSRTIMAYALRRDADDLAEIAAMRLNALRLPDDAMRRQFEPRLAKLIKRIDAADRTVLVMAKTPDQILLGDLIDHCGGRLDPRHVAWLVSELEALACCLEAGPGLVSLGLGPDTLLVSPAHHAVGIAGGWWYAAPLGTRLAAAPARALDHLPPVLLAAGAPGIAAMLDMIRLVACEALGQSGPVAARRDPSLPQPFKDWLLASPCGSAPDDYASWIRARDAAFGPRRFVELRVDPETIYRPIEE